MSQAARIDVKVSCRAARPGLAGRSGSTWRMRLSSAPVDGAANAELVELLSECLGVARRQITIVRGQKSTSKVVQIDGLDAQQVERALAARVAGGKDQGASTRVAA